MSAPAASRPAGVAGSAGPTARAGKPMRIGVLGSAGQIGRCFVRALVEAPDFELAFAVDRAVLDLARLDDIEPWLAAQPGPPPDLVVNAAAFTKVDACERERELAFRLNARMPEGWARALSRRGTRFLQLSTDYVFPGDGVRPYREDDPTGPPSVYGASKRAGELGVLAADPRALVVRTSWVFGPGRNFVLAILDQAAKRRRGEAEGPLRVVADQSGSPTSAADLAEALLSAARLQLGAGDPPTGLLHVCNAGHTTWYGFAREILTQAGYTRVEIEPVATGVFPTAAPRPAYSILDTSRAAARGIRLRPWTEALAGYLAGPDRPTPLLPERPAEGDPGADPAPGGTATAASRSTTARAVDPMTEPDRRKVSE